MGLKPGPEGKEAACRHLIWLWEECPRGGNSQHKGSEARLRPRAAARNWRGMNGLRERVAVTGGRACRPLQGSWLLSQYKTESSSGHSGPWG